MDPDVYQHAVATLCKHRRWKTLPSGPIVASDLTRMIPNLQIEAATVAYFGNKSSLLSLRRERSSAL